MRFQFHDYFGPNVTGTLKLFQKFWTTKFHQSEFGRQEPSTKRGSWDGHTQILTCFWPPFYNHNVWKLSAHFFMTFHGYCSFIIMGWNKFWSCIWQKPLFWWRSDTATTFLGDRLVINSIEKMRWGEEGITIQFRGMLDSIKPYLG